MKQAECVTHLAADEFDDPSLEIRVAGERLRRERLEAGVAIARNMLRVQPLAVDEPAPLESPLLFPLAPCRLVEVVETGSGRVAVATIQSVTRQGRINGRSTSRSRREEVVCC